MYKHQQRCSVAEFISKITSSMKPQRMSFTWNKNWIRSQLEYDDGLFVDDSDEWTLSRLFVVDDIRSVQFQLEC